MNAARFTLLCAALGILLFGCAGGGGLTSGSGRVTVTPAFSLLGPGAAVNLTADPAGVPNRTVTWSASGGTVSPTGPATATFTAPSQPGTYIVTVNGGQAPDAQANATIEVVGPGVTIRPNATSLVTSTSTDLVAAVIGPADQRVTWTVSAGTFVETGENSIRYTAPATAGSVTVTARSVADPSQSDTLTINVIERTSVVRGRVRTLRDPRIGVRNVQVVFFDAAGMELGRAATSSDGTFGIDLPMTATRFNLLPESIGPFWHTFIYGVETFDADVTTCTAPLPDLRGRLEVTLPNEIVLTENTAARPIPSGCR